MPVEHAAQYFFELAKRIFDRLRGDEVLLVSLEGEKSDFVRLNRALVRQAGNVYQQTLHLQLIENQKQCTAQIPVSGNQEADFKTAESALSRQRQLLPHLPEDPFINFATSLYDSDFSAPNNLPAVDDVLESIVNSAVNLDLVGIWASGEIMNGFANSLGQRNWHQTSNFNFDWSIYLEGDKAVKQHYAGYQWDQQVFLQKMQHAEQTLDLLGIKPISITPGHYRVFLAPSAVNELLDLLKWDAFGLKSCKTSQTPLLRLIKQEEKLHESVSLSDVNSDETAPPFTNKGFKKPGKVELILNGKFGTSLADPRSAKEYGASVNCNSEQPRSIEMQGGSLKNEDILKSLDTGVFISNLWYCNYSDRNHCRITGMTRFACLWIENGVPVAPLNVMRFDESIYRMFGNNLLALTSGREHIFDPTAYRKRSEDSALIPGALIDDFNFTL